MENIYLVLASDSSVDYDPIVLSWYVVFVLLETKQKRTEKKRAFKKISLTNQNPLSLLQRKLVFTKHDVHCLRTPCHVMYHLWLLYLSNKLWSLIGREPIMWRATTTHVPWLHRAEGNMRFANRCTLPWSFQALVDFQRLVRNNGGFEGIVKNSFLFEQLFVCL